MDKPIRPFAHAIDGRIVANKKLVNVDDRHLTPGNKEGSQRAFTTVFAPAKPGSAYKDIHEGLGGKITPVEGSTKQTWINFGDAQRAQYYVASYSEQHIKSDLKQSFNIAQQAADVGRIMQERKKAKGKSSGFSSMKTALEAHKARKNRNQFQLQAPSLFINSQTATREKIASQRMNAWGDAGPVIRGFDVENKTTREILMSSVVEEDKKATRSEVINVDQNKAANQVGVSGKGKQHLFKGILPSSLGSVVFNPQNMSDQFSNTSGQVSSLNHFEKKYGLFSTVGVVARLNQPSPNRPTVAAESIVDRRSKRPRRERK
ncbi:MULTISPECIES: hypothetical protein [unclassified Agarivorans]|uniref:hypothetical protein n=1 Tax=unclassified Agarivorans TaxID=2636026 RepID=UPI003D7E3AD7